MELDDEINDFGDKTTEESSEVKNDQIREKSFAFAVRIVKLCKYLEKNSDVAKSVINQLLDAGTSVGANLEETVAGQSKADFIHKNAIASKEASESNYWLRLILVTSVFEEKHKRGIAHTAEISAKIGNSVKLV